MEKFSHAYGICGPKMKRKGYIMKELFKEVHNAAPDGPLNYRQSSGICDTFASKWPIIAPNKYKNKIIIILL